MESQKKQLGTGTGILVNCKECLADRHDSCLNNGCLCAIETRHNAPTKEAKLIQEFTDKAKHVMPTREEFKEVQYYTDSALSDLFKMFFVRFKKDSDFKYVSMIDTNVIQSKVIKIDYFELTDKIKSVLEQEPKSRTHTAIYRAIAETFQIRYGSKDLDNEKNEDRIKFQIINYSDTRVYSNPKLINYEDYNKEDFEGIDKINNVANTIQKNNTFVTLRKTEEILLFNGKIYDKLQAETIIKEETEKLIPHCSTHDRHEVINKIKAQTYTDLEHFDTDSNLITLENGILNLDTMELTDHTPEHLSRVLIPVEYHKPEFDDIEENLKDTLFWKFLKSSFTVNDKFRQKDFETVLEIISSVFVKKHIDSRSFMYLGNGENGKSVCLGYIESLVGKNNVSHIPLQEISGDKFASAELDGKSANIFSDLERNELQHTGKIKTITDGEGLQVQRKHGQPFNLYPFAKLMFSCNKFPKVFDQTQGFFRRWIIVKWERNFENDPQRIEYLREKLNDNQEEKNLVFSCLVKITNKLNKSGKFSHSKDWKEIQREWNANADPLDDFVNNYIIDSDSNKTKRETYQFYKQTMLDRSEIPLGIGQFAKKFAEYFEFDRITNESTCGRTERVWLNIDFKRPIQTKIRENDSIES